MGAHTAHVSFFLRTALQTLQACTADELDSIKLNSSQDWLPGILAFYYYEGC